MEKIFLTQDDPLIKFDDNFEYNNNHPNAAPTKPDYGFGPPPPSSIPSAPPLSVPSTESVHNNSSNFPLPPPYNPRLENSENQPPNYYSNTSGQAPFNNQNNSSYKNLSTTQQEEELKTQKLLQEEQNRKKLENEQKLQQELKNEREQIKKEIKESFKTEYRKLYNNPPFYMTFFYDFRQQRPELKNMDSLDYETIRKLALIKNSRSQKAYLNVINNFWIKEPHHPLRSKIEQEYNDIQGGKKTPSPFN